MKWREFSAWIEISGEKASEYPVAELAAPNDDRRRSPRKHEASAHKTLVCYIPSEAGKRFSVKWTNHSYPHAAMGAVTMDGEYCEGIIIYDDGLPGGWDLPETGCHEGYLDDNENLQPFMFCPIERTDDDNVLGGDVVHEELGSIKVTIYPIFLTHEPAVAIPPLLSNVQVPERAKKGIDHQITLGETERLKKSASHESHVTYERSGPDLVTFRFLYRPLAVLQANGIAPRPRREKRIELKPELKPEPEPDHVPPPLDAEMVKTVEEARVLREKLAAVEAKLAAMEQQPRRVKREAGDEEGSWATPQNGRRKRLKLEAERLLMSGEVIDLT